MKAAHLVGACSRCCVLPTGISEPKIQAGILGPWGIFACTCHCPCEPVCHQTSPFHEDTAQPKDLMLTW